MSAKRVFVVSGVRFDGSQTVLVSKSGDRYHLPHVSGGDPICPTSSGDGEKWAEKDLGMVIGALKLCQNCERALNEVPALVDCDRVDDESEN